MKNILGTQEDLKLYNKAGNTIYKFIINKIISSERTYDNDGNQLTYKDSDGYSYGYTYDSNGNELTFKNSDGYSRGFDIPEFTMEQVVEKIGDFKLIK
jgi:YD repeat-containing protein